MAKHVCPTPGFEKLLVATDGSEFSKAAINEAIDIAKSCSSKLFVLSVVEMNPEYEAIAPKLIEKAEKESEGNGNDNDYQQDNLPVHIFVLFLLFPDLLLLDIEVEPG